MQNHTNPGSTGATGLLFLAEDQFAITVNGMFSTFSNNPSLTQMGDRVVSAFNGLLHQDNPALFTGLTGLQAAMIANPYYGSVGGALGQTIAIELALNFLGATNQS